MIIVRVGYSLGTATITPYDSGKLYYYGQEGTNKGNLETEWHFVLKIHHYSQGYTSDILVWRL